MTIVSDFRRNGSSVYQVEEYTVNKSINENNSASSFTAIVDNFKGDNINNFEVGDEVTIYYGQSLDFFNTPNNPYLMHYYDMNYSTGRAIYDLVGSNNFGFNGSPIWTSGISYNAVYISGYSDTPAALRATSTAFWNVTQYDPISFSFWLNTVSAGETGIISAAYDGLDKKGIHITLSNGSLLSYRMYSSLVNTEIRNSEETSIFSNGSWNHIVTTYDGTGTSSGAKIYLNGSNITSSIGSSTGLTDITSAYAMIGTAGYSDFKLDELAVFNKELSASEVGTLYDSGTGIFLTNRLLFTGILENISLEGRDDMEETMELSGRDYTARLMDTTVEPEIYTNWEVGSIVRDIMSKYVDDVTYSGVQTTSTVLDRIVFNHKPVYDAIRDLAAQAGYVFYVDQFKDLNFIPPGSVSSGYTFNSGNTIESEFEERRDSMYNQVWVYGDRYLNGFKQTFTAGSPLGGSIFGLLYKPHNVSITVSGVAIQPGNIYQLTSTPPSGVKYLVNYEDQQIIFTSGTAVGSNVPTSGHQVIITYDRLLPIVKVGDDLDSQQKYGKRVKVIIDKDIKDPNFAQEKMESELTENSEPKKEGYIKLRGVVDLVPSETCFVDLPFEGADNESFQIISVDYEFSKENNLTEDIATVKVNKRIDDLGDTIKQMMLDIKKLQAGDISDSDTITRFNYSTGSLGLRASGVQIYTRAINDSYILDHPVNGVLGVVNPNNVGSMIGTGLQWVTGAGIGYDRALSFGGIDNPGAIYISNDLSGTATELGSDTSWFAWTKMPSTYNIGSRGGVIIGTYPLTPTSTNLEYHVSGKIRVYWNAGQVDFFSSGIDYRDDTWHHIGFVRNAEDDYIKLYCDGVVNNSGLAGSSRIINYPLMIGRDFRAGGQVAFSGAIDDVRMYNRALTDAEVESLYAKEDVLGGLVLYHKFDECTGSITYNSSSVEMPTGDAEMLFRFNESGTTFYDETANYSGLSYSGTGIQTGVYDNGSSLLLNGSPSFMLINGSNTVGQQSNFSVLFWLNSKADTDTNYSIFGTNTYNKNGSDFWIHRQRTGLGNHISMQVLNGSSMSTLGSIVPGEWYHIAFTQDLGSWSLYINGQLDLTSGGNGIDGKRAMGTIPTDLGSINIGKRGDDTVWLSGAIDELRVYKRALSSNEILNLYNGKTIQPLLGDRRSAPVLVWSGGYY